ncbi:cytochrome C biogenesis protein [Gammaproteobacteria bacterium SCGC AG-212-F23]|nr:cytochrome C biogenesis protein [Gammaproteobacteria bacterium SCGC AG-212-F23]
MQSDIVNIGLGFLEGFALIISPCILPILPIIFAGSITGSKKRPLGIIIGFVFIFALFTFFSRKLVQYAGIDLNLIRHISFGILLLLGLIMLSSYLTEKFSQLTQKLANTGSTLSTANNPQGGLLSGILFGGLIAIIWTPCAGPILAAVIVQTVIQQSTFTSFLTLLAFGIGAAVPMLAIVFFGRSMIEKFSYFKTHTTFFRKLLGAIIIVSVVYMIYLESGTNIAAATKTNNNTTLNLQNALLIPYPAPAIGGIDAWINSEPLQLNQLKGKVILIDFWTYSCINCMRTLPYLNDWYHKYHDKGFIIIGIHSPEFAFEKNLANVKSAVAQDGIQYPVALDNQFVTWRNFNNQYWPAHYLIDKNGFVVYTHFGEGEYDITENNIRYLLGMGKTTSTITAETAASGYLTPETYLGYARAEHFASSETVTKDQSATYTFPNELSLHDWALQGRWTIMADKIVADQENAAIEIHFHARKVFIVMGNASDNSMNVKLLLNGKMILSEKGKDVINSSITIKRHTLYEAIVLPEPGDGILQMIASAPGLEMYTFTFG